MKPINALVISALVATFAVSGCETVQYIEVSPECKPPPEPVLPTISNGELWGTFVDAARYREASDPVESGDEAYRVLEGYINDVWAYSDEQGAMLGELCDKGGA